MSPGAGQGLTHAHGRPSHADQSDGPVLYSGGGSSPAEASAHPVPDLRPLSVNPRHHPAGRLEGCTAIVTGAARGVGEETVRVFCAEGASVVAADRDDAALRAAFSGADGVAVQAADVTSIEDAMRLVDLAQMGGDRPIDVLVNNAGATVRASVENTTDAVIAEALDVNLISVLRLCHLVAPAMRRHRHGAIVNVCSITALEGIPGAGAYSAAKGGVAAYTRALAVEVAPDNVRVNAVCPGVIDTDMTHSYVSRLPDPAATYETLVARQPMKRMASARDIALAILFLACDESSFISGVALPVDGARHAAGPGVT